MAEDAAWITIRQAILGRRGRPPAGAWTARPVKIELSQLSSDVLAAIVESFVLREGTDYGDREASFERKCDEVHTQLERGQAWIDFDPATETIDIRPSD